MSDTISERLRGVRRFMANVTSGPVEMWDCHADTCLEAANLIDTLRAELSTALAKLANTEKVSLHAIETRRMAIFERDAAHERIEVLEAALRRAVTLLDGHQKAARGDHEYDKTGIFLSEIAAVLGGKDG